jgi:hypothetical protein
MQIVSARPLCARSGEIILTVRRPMSALPPKADITAGLSESPLCANSGHSHCSKIFLFDYLVGAQEAASVMPIVVAKITVVSRTARRNCPI